MPISKSASCLSSISNGSRSFIATVATRGYRTEAVTDTILRRMPDYVNYICPQFAETDINFQRVPTVDTSNPFIARWIPTPDESMVVIRLKNPRGIDFPYLLSMIHNSFMSRANSIVIHGAKLDLAMQLILTPLILQLDRTQEAHGMTVRRFIFCRRAVPMFHTRKWPMLSASWPWTRLKKQNRVISACRWVWPRRNAASRDQYVGNLFMTIQARNIERRL